MPVSLPSNADIAARIIANSQPMIRGTAHNIAAKNGFSTEDREDLISHAQLKLLSVDWLRLFQKHLKWRRKNVATRFVRRARGAWTLEEISKVLGGLAKTTIQHAMHDHTRTVRQIGLSGLSMHKLRDLNFQQDELIDTPGGDHESFAIANEVAERAKKILSPEEWRAVTLLYGFDGCGEHNINQIVAKMRADAFHPVAHLFSSPQAADIALSYADIQTFLDNAIFKLRITTHDNGPSQTQTT